MTKWILALALCFFLAAEAGPALAQKDNVKAGPAAGKPGAGSQIAPSRSSSPARALPSGTGRPSDRAVTSGQSTNKKAAVPMMRSSTAPKSSKPSGGQKPDRPGGYDRPDRPGPDGKPGLKPGRRPGAWDRPGDRDHRPGRPGGDWDDRRHRPHRPDWDRCQPYCYGPTWYGYIGDDYDDYYEDYEDRRSREEADYEPQTYFSPGQFEFFQDPRLDWVAEGGLNTPATAPPPPGTMPSSDSGQSEDSLRQYEQMMKAWR